MEMATKKRIPPNVNSIIATDCGSTTTKAILIEKVNGVFKLISRGEAPTTVEAPSEDVTAGVRNAVRELEELTQRTFLNDEGVITPSRPDGSGVDIYLSTSSAGGGLQMIVAGVIHTMTAESAQRAALGAGAIVMDTISVDDGRKAHEKIQRIRHLRPDMILISGGIDGGTITHVVEISELIAAAEPRPRLGIGFELPIIYAGNNKVVENIKEILGEKFDLRVVENLRPILEEENLGPARKEIHNLFMGHVMAQAPGYNKLVQWANTDIMPTPYAVGKIIQTCAQEFNYNIIGVDIGGATTDVFSVYGSEHELFNRTVSANLGMSYSICNVLLEAGVANIMRWIPFEITEEDLRNRIRNKMIRPTTIPQTLEDLIIEQAIVREALRISFIHHRSLAVGLKGIQKQRDISDTFVQNEQDDSIINLSKLNMIVGSGGVLSHAPRRQQAVLMLLDSFQLEGVTELTVDSIFMTPQLGVLSEVHPQAAMEVFTRDCLIFLGTAIIPIGNAQNYGENCVVVRATMSDGKVIEKKVAYGSIDTIPLDENEYADVDITPTNKFDLGAGKGRPLHKRLRGGVAGGIIIDARGRRPFTLPEDTHVRRTKIIEWMKAVNAYPVESLDHYATLLN